MSGSAACSSSTTARPRSLGPSVRTRRAFALALLGEIGSRCEAAFAEPDQVYQKALALAEALGMRPLLAHCHVGLGRLYRRAGKQEQARTHLATGTAMYRELGMQFWLEKTEAEMSAVSLVGEESTEALA